jgi:hypothetical protein
LTTGMSKFPCEVLALRLTLTDLKTIYEWGEQSRQAICLASSKRS